MSDRKWPPPTFQSSAIILVWPISRKHFCPISQKHFCLVSFSACFCLRNNPSLALPFKSILFDLKSMLGRPLQFLWAAIWIPCTLPLPIFVPIVLWSLLTLLKCKMISFGDLWQKALSSWKFKIFYSAAFLRILRRNNFNCQITPRVNPD